MTSGCDMDIECKFKIKEWRGQPSYACVVKTATIASRNCEVTNFVGDHVKEKKITDVVILIFEETAVEYLPHGIHKIFPNLQCLTVDGCGLLEITRKDLDGLENLKEIYILSNRLTSLPNNLFNNMLKLDTITLKLKRLEFASSRILNPILNNELVSIRFYGCEYYKSSYPSQMLMKLMNDIDAKYKPPIEVIGKAKFLSNTAEGIAELWTSHRFSDFTIVVGRREFPVHKTILGIRSPVFAEIFESESREHQTSQMMVQDLSAESVEKFLKYLYTGEIDEAESVDEASEILSLAFKFNVADLKSKFEDVILENMSGDNAMEVLKLGNRHGLDKMKAIAFAAVKAKNFENDLDDSLMNWPEKLEKLINVKRDYEMMMESCSIKDVLI